MNNTLRKRNGEWCEGKKKTRSICMGYGDEAEWCGDEVKASTLYGGSKGPRAFYIWWILNHKGQCIYINIERISSKRRDTLYMYIYESNFE